MKRIFSLLMAVCSLMLAQAENNPYRNDYLWVVNPDHADWLYTCGEQVTLDIKLYEYGLLMQQGSIQYAIGDDMLEHNNAGQRQIQNGNLRIAFKGRKTPGFMDIKLKYGKQSEFHIKVGFDVDRIQPWTVEPQDFQSWWQQQIDAMHQTPLHYTKELASEYCTDKMDTYLIRLTVDKSHCIYAYLFYPKNAQPGRHPVVLCPPGAGIKTIKEPLRHRYYAEDNYCIRMEMEIHGLDPRLSEATFKDISNAFSSKDNSYLRNGLESRDRYYMRHVYLSLIRAIDLLTSLPEWDGMNVIVQGGSQGGALSMVAAGLDSRVSQCIVNHPALTDMGAYSEAGRTGGYPHFHRSLGGPLSKAELETLPYYDVISFARHITCPVYMTWGYCDSTCPPTTSYAAYNILTCPKEALITPINEHWVSAGTEQKQMEWIADHLLIRIE